MDSNVIFDPALLALVGTIGATIWFATAARRRGAGALAAVGAVTFFCGALIGLLGLAHTLAVIGGALSRRGPAFEYDFRLYSLVMLGVSQIAGGLCCLTSSWNVTRGDPRAWKAALGATTVLLIVNVPLMPIQGFAVGFSMFLAVTLLALIATRRRFVTPVGARTVTTAEVAREHARASDSSAPAEA